MYAVEASEMAEYARKLIAGNPLFADRITVRLLIQFGQYIELCYMHLSDVVEACTSVGHQG